MRIDEVQKHLVQSTVEGDPSLTFISHLSRHPSSKKNTIREEGRGLLAETQKEREGQKVGIRGSRRGKEERNRLSILAIV